MECARCRHWRPRRQLMECCTRWEQARKKDKKEFKGALKVQEPIYSSKIPSRLTIKDFISTRKISKNQAKSQRRQMLKAELKTAKVHEGKEEEKEGPFAAIPTWNSRCHASSRHIGHLQAAQATERSRPQLIYAQLCLLFGGWRNRRS